MTATPSTESALTGSPGAAVTAGPLTAMRSAPPPPVLRRRRRPALLGLGVAMVAVGALLAVWLAAGTGATVPVLAVARQVTLGEVITDADLSVVRITSDPALRPVPAERRDEVVGRRAATDLVPGALLTEGQVTDETAPAAGFALVGVAVKPTQMPDQPLRPGDQLLVVSTPPVDGDPSTDPPSVLDATVVRVGALDDTGLRVVDVTVPDADAADVAARAATGRIALVLQPRAAQDGARS
jgi:hypothetical protein